MAFLFWKVLELAGYYLGVYDTEDMTKSIRSDPTSPTNTDLSEGDTDPDASLSVLLDPDVVPVWTREEEQKEEESATMRLRSTKSKKSSGSLASSSVTGNPSGGTTSSSRRAPPQSQPATPGPSQPRRRLSKPDPLTTSVLPLRHIPRTPAIPNTPEQHIRPLISSPIPISGIDITSVPIPSYLSTHQKHKFTLHTHLQHLRYTHLYAPLPHPKPQHPPNPLALRHLERRRRALRASAEYAVREARAASTMQRRGKVCDRAAGNAIRTFLLAGTPDGVKPEEREKWVWDWDGEVLAHKRGRVEQTRMVKKMREARGDPVMAESGYVMRSAGRRRKWLEGWEERLQARRQRASTGGNAKEEEADVEAELEVQRKRLPQPRQAPRSTLLTPSPPSPSAPARLILPTRPRGLSTQQLYVPPAPAAERACT